MSQDYSALTTEATQLLVDLIKINTSNPPGNEIEAVKYVAKILDKEKIHYQIVESEPGQFDCPFERGWVEKAFDDDGPP